MSAEVGDRAGASFNGVEEGLLKAIEAGGGKKLGRSPLLREKKCQQQRCFFFVRSVDMLTCDTGVTYPASQRHISLSYTDTSSIP